MRLSELEKGKKAVITELKKGDALSDRLECMGYGVGTEVEILLENKDMIELKTDRKLVGVKRSECGEILVK